MIKVKHLMDAVEPDDGDRMWIEPIGLCKDLCGWCKVDHVLPHLGPPKKIWNWFESHPDGYDCFRATYHEALQKSTYKEALLAMACSKDNFTLVYQGDNANENTATAMYEFLSELRSYCPPE
jgi:uncharacterized protein YeaO (DUF488 family)